GETASDSNGYNPSAFAQWKNGGLGLTATDDVFRVHVKTFADADGLGLADPHLGIAPGAAVTLEWDIFPVSAEEGHSGDYWDFVNTVRRAWDANYPIPGPFVFFTDRPDEPANWYGEWARQRDVKIVAGRIAKYPNGRYAHGTGILH